MSEEAIDQPSSPLPGLQNRGWPDHLVCEHHGHGARITQCILIYGHSKYVAALFEGDELYDLQEDR